MRALNGFSVALIAATAAFAQGHGWGNPATPVFQGTFGNVVFPGGTASLPGVTRTFPNAVFPSGNVPRLSVPFSVTDPTANAARFGRPNGGRPGGSGFGFGNNFGFGGKGRGGSVVAVPYAVPIYVGGYAGYAGYYDNGGVPPDQGAAAGPPPPQQPSVVVVYPQAPGPPSGAYGNDGFAAGPPPPSQAAPAAQQNPANNADQTPANYYLIAFKDHTIYSAVAYWVEGDTLHYFTSGNTHNQVSLSLVDRDLTERLNREAGTNLVLPK